MYIYLNLNQLNELLTFRNLKQILITIENELNSTIKNSQISALKYIVSINSLFSSAYRSLHVYKHMNYATITDVRHRQ